jgi:hypothetical protein
VAQSSPDDRAFLTIIRWPDGLNRDACAALLAQASGLDETTLRMRIGQAPPAILAMMPQAGAHAAAKVVRRAGGDAFAPTMGDIETLGETIKIRRLLPAGSAFRAELWNGGSLHLDGSSIEIVIRARLSDTKLTPQPSTLVSTTTDSLMNPYLGTGWALGGGYGLALGFAASYSEIMATPEMRTRTSEKLDIHLADHRVLQIDGDKFGFEILGVNKGLTDNINIDRLCEVFIAAAPHAIVDPYFSLWKPPPDVRRLRLPRMTINKDDPAFAFYSRWAALMYRHMLGNAEGS